MDEYLADYWALQLVEKSAVLTVAKMAWWMDVRWDVHLVGKLVVLLVGR